MKKFVVAFCIFIIFGSVNNVFGDAAKPTYVNRHYFQNGTYEIRDFVIDGNSLWTKSRSPYVIEGKVIVGSGGTLTVEEGVRVLFKNNPSNSPLDIIVKNNGKLNISGSLGNQVVFSRFSDGDNWKSISFENGSSGNLEFGEFKFGGSAVESIINIASSDVVVNNSKFTNSSASAISIVGVVDPIIKSTEFDLDKEYVILQKDVNADPILKNLFSNNKPIKIKIEAGTSLGSHPHISRDITWEDPSIPYVMDGWLNVGDGGVLNIKPNVQILFSKLSTTLKGNITVQDKGSLIADGVIFKPEHLEKDNTWDYIFGEEGSILYIENCFINYGGYSDKGSLRIDTSDANIKNTTISNSTSHGLYFGKSNITPLFEDMIIENGSKYGIYLKENAKPKFKGILQRKNWRDGVFVECIDLYETNIWKSDEGPYYLNGIYSIKPDASLQIDPGTTIYFDISKNLKRSSIIAESGSKFISNGTEANPIIYTSSSSSPKPNDWGNITFRENSMGRFDYSIFEYGGENDYLNLNGGNTNYGVLNILSNNLVVHNSIFRNLNNNGIYIEDEIAPYCIQGNRFEINSNNFGIYKWDKTVNVNASYNWWNHITGAYNLNINPGGYGTMVSDEVNIFDFLKVAYETPNIIWKQWGSKTTTDINKKWSVEFNFALDPKYVNTSYINVLDSKGEYIDIEVGLKSDTTLTVKSKGFYDKGKYTLIIKQGLKSSNGKQLNQEIKTTFYVR